MNKLFYFYKYIKNTILQWFTFDTNMMNLQIAFAWAESDTEPSWELPTRRCNKHCKRGSSPQCKRNTVSMPTNKKGPICIFLLTMYSIWAKFTQRIISICLIIKMFVKGSLMNIDAFLLLCRETQEWRTSDRVNDLDVN